MGKAMPFEVLERRAKIAALEDRIAELEELLGIGKPQWFPYRSLGLPPASCKVLAFIMRRPLASSEAISIMTCRTFI
jgi:hypothetical protein